MSSSVKSIEVQGTGHIPESNRHSSPMGLFGVFIGAQMCFNLVVLGWLPIRFGLGFLSAISAIATGLLLGCLLVGPFALLGTRTGTNSAVSSGAYFGVKGRLIGSFLTFFISLGFFALVIWTGGDAIAGGISRVFEIEAGYYVKSLSYLVMGLGSIGIAIYGHDKVAEAQRVVAVVLGLLFLAGVVALAPRFDVGYAGGAYVLGSFWPTWCMSVVTAFAVPVSYAPFSNDYSRYISSRKHTALSVSMANGGGLFVGCMAVMSFGAFEGSIFDVNLGPIGGLLSGCPTWYLLPVILIGVIGPLSHGALCLYAPGLDLSSLSDRFSRANVTLWVGLLGLVIVFLGAFVWGAVDAFVAFVTLFTVATTPWIVIILIGHFHRRGFYQAGDLQCRGETGRKGIYWFSGGWNTRALLSWIPAVVIGLLLSHTTLFDGPWSGVAGGIDVSAPAAAVIGGVIYAVAMFGFPESVAVSRLQEDAKPHESALNNQRLINERS